MRVRVAALLLLPSLFLGTPPASAQGTLADYQRAMTLRDTYQGLAVGVPDAPTWIGRTNRFWFRRSVKGGNEFAVVNPDTKTVDAAIDHARLASGLAAAANAKYTAVTLPFNAFT